MGALEYRRTNMNILEEHWRKYRDACYPEGCPADQKKECQQAFFAGAFVALKEIECAACLSEEAAFERTNAVCSEAAQFCQQRLDQMGRRN